MDKKAFSFRSLCSLTPSTPLGSLPSGPHYRFALHALAMVHPLANTGSAAAGAPIAKLHLYSAIWPIG